MTPRLRAPAIVEGSFLAAIAVLLFLAREYVPVMDLVGMLFCPAPFIYLAARHGCRTALLAAGVTMIVLSWASPFLAVLSLMTGLLGVALGEGIRRRLPWSAIIVIGTFVLVAALAPMLALTRAWLGVDPVAQMLTLYERGTALTLAWARAGAAGDPAILRQIEQMAALLPYTRAAMPAMLVFAAAGTALLNTVAAAWLLGRLGLRLPPLPQPTSFRCSPACLAGLAAGAALMLAERTVEPWRWVLGWNIALFFALLYLLQGLAVVAFYFDEWTRDWRVKAQATGTLPLLRLARVVTLLLLLLQGWQLLIPAGLLDTWLDFRKLRAVQAGGGKPS